jgi:hypothetical protein
VFLGQFLDLATQFLGLRGGGVQRLLEVWKEAVDDKRGGNVKRRGR